MLEQDIKADIDERQKLMLQIKTLYLRYEFNKKDEQLFLNYSIPAVYAIWEGFIQTAFRSYIQTLNQLNLTVDLVCEPILLHHLEKKFRQFKAYPTNTEHKISFLKNLTQFYTNKLINIKTFVNTESNVGFKVMNKLLAEFNLGSIKNEFIEYSEINIKSSLSGELKRLVDLRNDLAHGQNAVVIHRDDLDRAIKVVEILMDLVLEKIIDGFENESYLNNNGIQ